MDATDRGALGQRGERLALGHLQAAGLALVVRNFRCRHGEIDLVMSDGDCLVFTEVRYRKARGFASAAASVDRSKRRKLERTAAFYITRHPHEAMRPMRFDVVAIDARDRAPPSITWIRDAFRPGE